MSHAEFLAFLENFQYKFYAFGEGNALKVMLFENVKIFGEFQFREITAGL